MSYYDPYFSTTPRSRRASLSYVPAPSSYHEPLAHSYSQPAYSMYAGSNIGSPRIAYDDVGVDPYYRSYTPSYAPSYAPPYTPSYAPSALTPFTRPRRLSSVSYATSPGYAVDPLRRGGFGRILKFKRKGAFRAGITIGEAQANVRLSDVDAFTLQDLGADIRGKIYVNLRWPGYSPLNYEIPVDGYSGYVDLQSLARRVGRAVSHYLQANVIPIRWDQIEMQHLEELSIGMWHLKMSTQ